MLLHNKWDMKEKCKVLHMVRNNHRHQYTLRTTKMESSSAEKNIGVLANITLNMTLDAKSTGIFVSTRQSIPSN